MDIYNKHDAAGLAKLYTDDEYIMSGPAWTTSGRAAIEDAVSKNMAIPVFSKINLDKLSISLIVLAIWSTLIEDLDGRLKRPRREGRSGQRPLAHG